MERKSEGEREKVREYESYGLSVFVRGGNLCVYVRGCMCNTFTKGVSVGYREDNAVVVVAAGM